MAHTAGKHGAGAEGRAGAAAQRGQSKVALHYDETTAKVMQRFSTLVGSTMQGFHHAVHEERKVLEKLDFSVDPQHIFRFLARLPAIRKKLPQWERDVELLGRSARELKEAGFKHPQGWLTFERASSEWEAFNQALEVRNQDVNREKGTLLRRVLEQEKKVDEEFQELKKEWHKQRLEGAGCQCEDALHSIAFYQQKAEDLKEQFSEVREAKEALRDMNMDALTEDIASFKDVWDQLAAVQSDLGKLGDMLWEDVIPLKLKGQLREIEGKLQQFGSAIRNYPAFNQLQQMVESYSKYDNIITDLKSEALKDRHWLELQKSLRGAEGFDDMQTLTLGKVWAADLQKYQASIEAIVRQAQGELALEEFLAQVKKHWDEAKFEVVDFQKCCLITGWVSCSEKLSEHIDGLRSMRKTPHFKQFEAECTSWEQKLLAIQGLFGMPGGKWYDVHHRWVQLERIFAGSQDITRQLPDETNIVIGSVDAAFKQLMAQVKETPFVMDSFQIPGVHEQLSVMLNALTAVQTQVMQAAQEARAREEEERREQAEADPRAQGNAANKSRGIAY